MPDNIAPDIGFVARSIVAAMLPAMLDRTLSESLRGIYANIPQKESLKLVHPPDSKLNSSAIHSNFQELVLCFREFAESLGKETPGVAFEFGVARANDPMILQIASKGHSDSMPGGFGAEISISASGKVSSVIRNYDDILAYGKYSGEAALLEVAKMMRYHQLRFLMADTFPFAL
jgi:hypothetical protein